MIFYLLTSLLLLTLGLTLALEFRFFAYSFYDFYRYSISLVDRFKRKKVLYTLELMLTITSLILTLISYPIFGVIFNITSLVVSIIEVPKVKVKFTRRNMTLMVTSFALIATSYLLLIKFDKGRYVSIIGCILSVYVFVFISYIISYPIECLVQNHYIKNAKKKMEDNPKLKIIGITGSYGKTTFKNSLKTLLSQERILCSPGNINTPMGLVRFINDKLSPVDTILILEMGIDRVKGMQKFKKIFKLDYAVITSIGMQHLRTMRTLDNIYKAKTDIVNLLKPNGMIVYCKNSVKPSEKLRKPFIEYSKDDYVLQETGNDKNLKYKSVILQTKLTSLSAINHSFGAYLLSKDILHNNGNLEQRFSEIKEVSRRKKTTVKNGVTIIDDSYNINSKSSKESFELVDKYSGSKGVVTAGLVELGSKFKNEHYEFGRGLTRFDTVFFVGKINKSTYKGFIDNGGISSNICHIKKLKEVDQQIKGIDVLLILPVGGAFSLS